MSIQQSFNQAASVAGLIITQTSGFETRQDLRKLDKRAKQTRKVGEALKKEISEIPDSPDSSAKLEAVDTVMQYGKNAYDILQERQNIKPTIKGQKGLSEISKGLKKLEEYRAKIQNASSSMEIAQEQKRNSKIRR